MSTDLSELIDHDIDLGAGLPIVAIYGIDNDGDPVAKVTRARPGTGFSFEDVFEGSITVRFFESYEAAEAQEWLTTQTGHLDGGFARGVRFGVAEYRRLTGGERDAFDDFLRQEGLLRAGGQSSTGPVSIIVLDDDDVIGVAWRGEPPVRHVLKTELPGFVRRDAR